MEQRRDPAQALGIFGRVTQLGEQRIPLRSPPGRNAFQRPQPVGDTEDVYPGLEYFRPKRQRRGHHVAAVTPAHDADPVGGDPVHRGQHVACGNHIIQVAFAMAAVISRIEGLAVAGTAAVVDVEDRVAVVDQVLVQRRVPDPRLAAGSAMDAHQHRYQHVCRGAVRPVQNTRDFHAVVRGKADHFAVDQVIDVDFRVQRGGQGARIGG